MLASIVFDSIAMISEFPTLLDSLVGIADFLEDTGFDFWNTYSPGVLNEYEISEMPENLFLIQDLFQNGFEVYIYNNVCYDLIVAATEVKAIIERDGFIEIIVRSEAHGCFKDMVHYETIDLMRNDILVDGRGNALH